MLRRLVAFPQNRCSLSRTILLLFISVSSYGQQFELLRADCKGRVSDTLGRVQFTRFGNLIIEANYSVTGEIDSSVHALNGSFEENYQFDKEHVLLFSRKSKSVNNQRGLQQESTFNGRGILSTYTTETVIDSTEHLYRQFRIGALKNDTLEISLIHLDEDGRLSSRSTTDLSGAIVTTKFTYSDSLKARTEIWVMQQGIGLPVMKESRNYVYTSFGQPKAEVLFLNGDDTCSSMLLYSERISKQ